MQCKLDHVNIVCQDLNHIIKFFTENLGAKLIAMKIFGGVDGASLDLGGTLINLRVKQKNERYLENPSGKTYGYHHIGLRVDDIDASYRELVENGFKFSAPPVDVVDLRIAFFTGPENMTFELVQVKLPAHRAGHLKNRQRGIASPLPLLRIHPRPQDGVFCGKEFIK